MRAERTDAGARTYRYTWADLRNGEAGVPVLASGIVSAAFQVFGSPGVGGEIVLEGSCEEPGEDNSFFVLRDRGDALIRFIKPGGAIFFPVVTSLRPRVVKGDGDTSLMAVLLVRSK